MGARDFFKFWSLKSHDGAFKLKSMYLELRLARMSAQICSLCHRRLWLSELRMLSVPGGVKCARNYTCVQSTNYSERPIIAELSPFSSDLSGKVLRILGYQHSLLIMCCQSANQGGCSPLESLLMIHHSLLRPFYT